MSIRTKLLLYFLGSFAFFLTAGFFSVYKNYHDNVLFKERISSAITLIDNASKRSAIAHLVRYDDEVLTQSARNYAFTGDRFWRDRYFEFVPKLDLRIQEAIEFGGEEDIAIFTSIGAANEALIRLEEEAIALVDADDRVSAQKILEDEEYVDQKAIYKSDVDKYLSRHGIKIDQANPISTRFLKDAEIIFATMAKNSIYFLFGLVGMFVVIVMFLLAIIISMFMKPLAIFKIVARKIVEGDLNAVVHIDTKDEIGDFADDFNTMTGKLKESIESIQKKVDEQTHDLTIQTKKLNEQKMALLNVLKDVQAEKTKSESLARDLEKFKLAVENASDHIVITDANGIVLYGNKMVEEITGYALTEAAGKKAGVLWRKPMDRHYYENLWKTIKIDKKPFVGTLTNRRKNGEAYEALISISPVLNNAGDVVYFVGIERDITKEKEIDRAKTEFVSLAAHQLKTPVGAFNWNLEMMIHGGYGPISDEQKEVLSDLYTMNKRMSDLITSLLNVSRIELGVFIIEPVPVDWIKLCDEVLVELDQRIRAKHHDVSKHYGEHVPTVLADPKLLRIIFQNFISNAVKYTKDAGRIHISIIVKDETIVVSVANNGEPIPASEKEKIFGKLYRASNAQKQDPDGNGLGLYVVKEIIEHGGGKVWFESEEGKDTVFYCSFPLSGMVEKKGNINLS